MVNRDNIRMFMTEIGPVIGEEEILEQPAVEGQGFIGLSSSIKLMHPFRIMPNNQGQMSIAAVFIKEEWITIPIGRYMELSLNEGMKQLYVDYEQQVFGSIILAAPNDKLALKV